MIGDQHVGDGRWERAVSAALEEAVEHQDGPGLVAWTVEIGSASWGSGGWTATLTCLGAPAATSRALLGWCAPPDRVGTYVVVAGADGRKCGP